MTQLSLYPLAQAVVRIDALRRRRTNANRYRIANVALNRHLQRDIGITADFQDGLPVSTHFAAKRYLVTWRRRWRWL
ncbi:hypothetical protein BZJ19_07305 [Salinivibrio proteolyticus]|uniref:hypothetical protein n=1 Tax=Salinivibrio TaxID=51366 RepID=UPI0009899B4F|nr:MULTISPECIES: hypothetical protein [Salinivibrio]OOF20556.1 hypothetical protein BZJ17_12340 [Salinivibrio sp. IB574]OOF25831.1 hypothetical protein BZJ19_07305 [Salinivibrio proteolyticus]